MSTTRTLWRGMLHVAMFAALCIAAACLAVALACHIANRKLGGSAHLPRMLERF